MELILLAVAAAVFFLAPVDRTSAVPCLVSYNGECTYTDTAHEPMALVSPYTCH